MLKDKLRFYAVLKLVTDIALLIGSFFLAYWLIWGTFRPNFEIFFLKVSAALIGCWLVVIPFTRIYSWDLFSHFEKSISNNVKAIALHALLVALTTVLIREFSVNRLLFVSGYAIFAIADLLMLIFLLYLVKRDRESGRNRSRVIVLGGGEIGGRIYEVLKNYTGYGYDPIGVFDDRISNNGVEIKGTIEQGLRLAVEQNVNEIFCALPLREKSKINELLRFAETHLIRFRIVPDFSAFHNRNIQVDFYGFYPVISLYPEPLANIFNRIAKRSFDIVFSAAVIILVLSWLYPLVAVLIKISSKGPVLYIQNRSGKNYRTFRCFKFRTMTVTESDEEYRQATVNDARVTGVGKFLRKYNIDELPQFFNVLLGDMSVVGPRPHPIKLNEIYRPMMEGYMTRHLAKPGITGLAQVRGFRGETANIEDMKKRVEADLFYIENWSFFLDIKIILLTILNMLRGEKNAY